MADLVAGASALSLAWGDVLGERTTAFAASDGPMSVELRASRRVASGARASWTWTVRVGFRDDGGFALGGASLKLHVTGGARDATEAEAKAAAERIALNCQAAAEAARALHAVVTPEGA